MSSTEEVGLRARGLLPFCSKPSQTSRVRKRHEGAVPACRRGPEERDNVMDSVLLRGPQRQQRAPRRLGLTPSCHLPHFSWGPEAQSQVTERQKSQCSLCRGRRGPCSHARGPSQLWCGHFLLLLSLGVEHCTRSHRRMHQDQTAVCCLSEMPSPSSCPGSADENALSVHNGGALRAVGHFIFLPPQSLLQT